MLEYGAGPASPSNQPYFKITEKKLSATFTYTFSIQALRIRSYPVKYDKDFLNDTTDHFEHLVHTLYDAFDRMVMQSDFRDVYNGIQLANFSVNKIPENKETKLAYDNLIVNFLLQLSKKSNEKRLQEVFKRQLRLSNYSIGGTDLYTTQSGADSLVIMDYLYVILLHFFERSSNWLSLLSGLAVCIPSA
uniref:SEA domain-containing protein n=1 Tax=Glossina pallidipes TaxID=7398 RepID=A0A1A9Z8N7_GLOPL